MIRKVLIVGAALTLLPAILALPATASEPLLDSDDLAVPVERTPRKDNMVVVSETVETITRPTPEGGTMTFEALHIVEVPSATVGPHSGNCQINTYLGSPHIHGTYTRAYVSKSVSSGCGQGDGFHAYIQSKYCGWAGCNWRTFATWGGDTWLSPGESASGYIAGECRSGTHRYRTYLSVDY